jgi:OOP family OmpA-OmpF porin
MNKGVLAILGIAAAAIAGPAAAQERGLYLGGFAGYSQYTNSCDALIVPCKDDTTAWRGFGGYQFNPHLALEAGYGFLGRAEGSGPIAGGFTGSFKQEARGWDVSMLGSFNLSRRLSAFGRLGGYSVRSTLDIDAPPGPSTHDANTNSGFTYGAGLAYNLGILGVRLEWLRYANLDIANNKDDIDIFGGSLLIRF